METTKAIHCLKSCKVWPTLYRYCSGGHPSPGTVCRGGGGGKEWQQGGGGNVGTEEKGQNEEHWHYSFYIVISIFLLLKICFKNVLCYTLKYICVCKKLLLVIINVQILKVQLATVPPAFRGSVLKMKSIQKLKSKDKIA